MNIILDKDNIQKTMNSVLNLVFKKPTIADIKKQDKQQEKFNNYYRDIIQRAEYIEQTKRDNYLFHSFYN